ncbi:MULTISPECIES: methionyl-tRNA formyltransferase [unclassified Psychrobacter]|uniref:methionyl-tRNA formyltransferase n=1 Tax=unclassified Psychrobacter TaxID=196806 RepID=UPI000C34EC01|nr:MULTISPECIES: methionyl-tRNA formyltransferase [unclassified Psychrobacter]MBA6243427.1 methionyl-tRNA formyltransferase [Psychrobacter sp. Urea-trap-18]MBA6286044.1 methionyl-tRNA formyltransferase [Psychrobacter sp. Urea-trap-16]MBA6318259.1 methionyl-tRNA formyltransferase [Psychrobacter sp. Urea-trap-20]MBA6333697.1 methionyl-tRNA formyltransferase [Psychrobacter sp. Urea-trap-19]PKG61267.1 methionyl-tRNA formyltransferase [Psychrobacter sp. Choline-3u-12]
MTTTAPTFDTSNLLTDHDNPTTNRLRVVFAGTPEFAAISLESLIKQQEALNIEIVAVYTQPDRKAGRGQKLSASAVKDVALANDIAVEQPLTFKKSSAEGLAARQTLRTYQPDVMIVAAYGLILPIGVLETPTHGCLNIHASLLPRWRGAAPIHRALLAGDDETGITIMQMDKGLDTGDMLYKVSESIASDDTAASLHDKMAALGATAISTVLKDLTAYQTQAIAQDDSQANYAEKLVKTEGEVDWSQPAAAIERQIRGLTPWPGAYTFLAGQRVKVLASLPVNTSQQTNKPAGTVISVGRKAILVACGKESDAESSATTLAITHLQFAGGKPMTAEQVCHGNQLNDGDQFTTESK